MRTLDTENIEAIWDRACFALSWTFFQSLKLLEGPRDFSPIDIRNAIADAIKLREVEHTPGLELSLVAAFARDGWLAPKADVPTALTVTEAGIEAWKRIRLSHAADPAVLRARASDPLKP